MDRFDVIEKLISGIALSLCAYIFYSTIWGPYKTTMVHYTIFLGATLIIFFCSIKCLGKSNFAFFINNLIIFLIIFGFGYVILFWRNILSAIGGTYLSGWQLISGSIIILVVLEAVRRVSIGLFIIAVLAIFYTLFGNLLPGVFSHPGMGLRRFIYLTAFSHEGIFGIGLTVASTYLFMFILFSTALQKTGASDFFLKISNSLVGKYRGGPAKCAVIASSLIGTISGSSISNVVTTGSFTIPLMKKMGFRPHMAGAIEVLSSEGGQLMPPIMGAGAFIMAELTGIPYWSIAISAIIPALLYYLSAYVVVDVESAKLGMKGIKGIRIERNWKIFAEGWHYLFAIFVLLYLLLITRLTVTFCGLIAVLTIIILNQVNQKTRLGFSQIFDIFNRGTRNASEMTALIASIGIVQQAFTITGLGHMISDILIEIAAGNSVLLLIMAMGITLILGMGLPTPIAYLISALFVSPALISTGFPKIATHLFLFFFAIKSGSTPPVAIVSVVAAGIAQSNWWKTALLSFQYSLPGFFIAYGFMYHPEFLFNGKWVNIIINFLFGAIGTVGIALALEKYFLTKLKLLESIILGIASVVMIMAPLIPTIISMVIVILISLIHWKRYEKIKNLSLENK
jgi:TRAP transporter 4TM/12TM fusion protein